MSRFKGWAGVALALCMTGCSHLEDVRRELEPRKGTIVQPVELVTAAPAHATAVSPGMRRVLAVDSLYVWCLYGKLNIQTSGFNNTAGWREARLNRLTLDKGYLTYEIIAFPPDAASGGSVRQGFTVKHQEPMPFGVTRVRVVSQSNEMQADVQVPGCR